MPSNMILTYFFLFNAITDGEDELFAPLENVKYMKHETKSLHTAFSLNLQWLMQALRLLYIVVAPADS